MDDVPAGAGIGSFTKEDVVGRLRLFIFFGFFLGFSFGDFLNLGDD